VADAEFLHVGRQLPLQKTRGIGAAKGEHAQLGGRLRQIHGSGLAHLCF
jgi:hypothetical protein